MWRVSTALIGALLIAGSSACAGSSDAEVPSGTGAQSESQDGEPQAIPSDEWADAMWDDHLEDLVTWWNAHYESECDITRESCHEHFSEGQQLMAGYADALRDEDSYENQPDYVPSFYAGEVNMAARSLEAYRHACPDGDLCEDAADGLERDVYELIAETDSWWD